MVLRGSKRFFEILRGSKRFYEILIGSKRFQEVLCYDNYLYWIFMLLLYILMFSLSILLILS